MATLDLGKIKPLYKGFYSPTTSFEPLDFTIYLGVLYVCKQACTGVEPTDIGYFDPVNINSTDLLALIKQVDGPGSGLDADTLDGLHASELQTTITGAATSVVNDNLAANVVVVTTVDGKLAAAAITATELACLEGVTTNIQHQLDFKQSTVTGAASSITSDNLPPAMVLVTNADGKVTASTVISAAELAYLEGVTSSIQTQLDNKLDVMGLSDYLQKVLIQANKLLVTNADGKATSAALGIDDLATLNVVNADNTPNLISAGTRKSWTKGVAAFTGMIAIEITGLYTQSAMNGVMEVDLMEVGNTKHFRKLVIHGQWNNGTSAWDYGFAYDIIGGAATQVRFARNTTTSKVYVLLGKVTTSWTDTRVVISVPVSSWNSGLNLGFAVSTLNSFTNITTDFNISATQSINSNSIFGFKNYVINGKKAINQRNATSTDNSYNQDRWYKSGNNWYQGIVGNSNLIDGKTYTLSWVGNATASYYVGTATSATINSQPFTAISNGGSFTLTISAEQNLWINFASDATGSTFNFVQLEEGSVATPFEHRPQGLELLLCQRFYEVSQVNATGYGIAGMLWTQSIPLKVPKRVMPTVVVFSPTGASNMSTITADGNNVNTVVVIGYVINTGAFGVGTAFSVSAEL